ncbi:MAG TPA: SDR family NAD(P)-dependent oxidoreductase [Ktedonobacteraceae bacterium]
MSQSSFGARSTASEVIAGHDLSGKTILITGASAGIGYETVRALLSAHAEVIIAGRDRARGEQAVQALQRAYPESPVHFLPLDLGLLASVRQTVEQFFARWNRLDVLINNAAIAAVPLSYTPDGFEQQFATNFLGHFLLAQLLLPALRSAAPARVVSLTSGTHRASDIHFDDIQYRHRPYDKWEAYGQSKTADALLAVALTRRFRAQGITANAVNPGGVSRDFSGICRMRKGVRGTTMKQVISIQSSKRLSRARQRLSGPALPQNWMELAASTWRIVSKASRIIRRFPPSPAICPML